MGHIIIHHKGAYNIFSTVVDAPLYEQALTLEELTEIIKTQHGTDGLRDLPKRLERAVAIGTSSILDNDLAHTIGCNRAGDNEKRMPVKKFIKQFLTLPTTSPKKSARLFLGVPVTYDGDPEKIKRLERCFDRLLHDGYVTIRISEDVADKLLAIMEPEVARIDTLLKQVVTGLEWNGNPNKTLLVKGVKES